MGFEFQQLRGIPPKITRDPVTARVSRVDVEGIWAVPIVDDSDMRVPVGPCRGLPTVAVGDVVLVVFTQERPWAITG